MQEFYMGRDSTETWREAVARQGRRHGLEQECVEAFDAIMAAQPNLDEAIAAFDACYKWDALELVGG